MIGNDRFLYCRDCNEVHKVTPYDRAPIYDLQGSRVCEIPTDDRRQFTRRHAGHAIVALSSVAEDWLNPQGAIDPMAESYMVAANERDFIVLHRSRRSIAEPIAYHVMPRQLTLRPSALDREALRQRTRHLRAHWLRSKARLRRKWVRRQLNQLTLFTPGRIGALKNNLTCRTVELISKQRAARRVGAPIRAAMRPCG